MMLREMGFSEFVYDEEEEEHLFRFRDGRFAFSPGTTLRRSCSF